MLHSLTWRALCAGLLALFTALPGQTTAANNDHRTIEFVNMCPSTVRIGVNGAALLKADSGDRLTCDASTSCPTGSSCLITGTDTSGFCYFDFPEPKSGSAVLKPGGSSDGTTATYVLDNPVWSNGVIVKGGVVNNIPVKWSGNVYAATGCEADGSNCQTGMCPKSSGGVSSVVPCQTGVGPQGPTTLAEFTFSNTGVDFYDISMVNSANVPVAMEPTATAAANPNGDDPYWCATPGSTAAQGDLAACDWSFDTKISGTEQADVLRAVTGGGAACSDGSSCSGGEVCGYAYTVGTLDVTQSCGTQIGWWNANELCAFTNGGFGDPVNCSTKVAGQGTNRDLFQCIGANAASCYGAGGDACCGCPEWEVAGVKIPLAPGFSCTGTNASWTSIAEPWVAFNKMACPTAYSFPFDDATSTFTCSSESAATAATPNAMDYKITFCPGGKTGY